MITFILIFAVAVVAIGAYFIATGATNRKRSGQAGASHVQAQQAGDGAPKVSRATGRD